MKTIKEAEDEGYVHSFQTNHPFYWMCVELGDLYDKIPSIEPREVFNIIAKRKTESAYHPFHDPKYEEIMKDFKKGFHDFSSLKSALLADMDDCHRAHHARLRQNKPGGICDVCRVIEDYCEGCFLDWCEIHAP